MGSRVEEAVNPEENIIIDETPQDVPLQEIPKRGRPRKETVASEEASPYKDEPVNCLRNEKVIVRFIPRPTAMVQDPKHVLYGGMAENAKKFFVVPKLPTGQYKNVLTNAEKAFLEKELGLEYNALSVHRQVDNFWDDSNPNGIGKVVLHKQDNVFDLMDPIDYIKVKVLKANKDQICPSMQELEDRPKATYQFVILSESAETASNLSKMDATMECYTEYGAIRSDSDTLRMVIELLEGRPVPPRVKLDFLQTKVNEYIQRDPRKFLHIIKDELLPYKVLIKRSLEAGLIGRKNDTYYLRSDGSPLCEMNEESTLNNAARYLSSIKRKELKYSLEAQLKQ